MKSDRDSFFATSRRESSMSRATIFSASITLAQAMAHKPTGPAPITATVSPFLISHNSAPKYPLDNISPTNKAFS